MKDPLYHNGSLHSNLSKAYIELPLLSDCSDDANSYRDYLKSQVLNITFLQQHSISLNITKNIYDKWNPEGFSHGNCSYGSGQNQLTMTYITFTGWLSYAGCWAASLSSGIASIVGAPRILQVSPPPSLSLSHFHLSSFRLWERTTSTPYLVSLRRVTTPTMTPSEDTS